MQKYWKNINIFNGTFFKKPLYVHFLWAIMVIIIIVSSASLWLNIFTNHNDYTKVPNLIKLNTTEAIKLLDAAELDYLIADSIYLETYLPNTIVRQIPDANATVKSNRTVYLIVNRYKAPFVEFPNIDGVRYATMCEIVKAKGFVINDTIYKDDVAKDVVIDQLYNNRSISAGEKLPLNSSVTIVLGNGKMPKNEFEWVPNLLGMNIQNASQEVQALKLKLEIQSELPTTEQEKLFITKQIPEHINETGDKNKLMQGSTVVVWLGAKKQ